MDKTLLQEALAESFNPHQKTIPNKEEVDLILAYINGEINARAVCKVLKKKTTASNYISIANSWIMPRLLRAVEIGNITVSINENDRPKH